MIEYELPDNARAPLSLAFAKEHAKFRTLGALSFVESVLFQKH
jgi:hypothetical protein